MPSARQLVLLGGVVAIDSMRIGSGFLIPQSPEAALVQLGVCDGALFRKKHINGKEEA